MNPLSFMGLRTIKDPEIFTMEMKKVFEVMHVSDTQQVELIEYQLKSFARTWFDQLEEGRDEDALHTSWDCFEEAFLGSFFPPELKEVKVRQFRTLKKDSLSVHLF